MGYKVDFDALDAFDSSLSNQINAWGTELEDISKALETVQTTKNMSGEGADNIKAYFENVHGIIQGLLGQLMSAHQKNCFLYKRDYFSNIDKATHVLIKESELKEIKSDVKNKKNRAVQVDDALAEIMSGIRDIYYLSYKDVGNVYYAHQNIESFITELDNDIKSLENRHYQNDFVNTGELIHTLTAFIKECKTKGRSYKKNFDIYDLAGSESFQKLYAAYVEVDKEQQSKLELIETEVENQKERVEILEEERAERERKAKVFKWVVTAVCIVGSIAITVATGGAGAPLIAGAVSAGSAVVSTSLHGMADEYIEHGYDHSEYDWGKIAADTVREGAKGFVSGALGACIGGKISEGLGSSVFKKGLQSTNSLKRIGTAAVIGSVSEVSTGIITRSAEETIDALTGGDASIGEVLSVKSIVTDAATGGVGGAVDDIVKQKGADKFAQEYNSKHDPVGDAEKAGLKNVKRGANDCPDFKDSDAILKLGDSGDVAEVKIKATGNHQKDYRKAEKILKEQGYDIDFKSMRTGDDATHVWHHCGDYNTATKEVTMQFITIDAHNVTKPHAGGAGQYYIVSGNKGDYAKKKNIIGYEDWNISGGLNNIAGGVNDTIENIDDFEEKNEMFFNGYYAAIPTDSVVSSKIDLDRFFGNFDFAAKTESEIPI